MIPVTSGFHRVFYEVCVLLGSYATSNGNPLPTFRDSVSVPLSSLASWPLKKGPIRCPETLVKDYHSTLRNTPEERLSIYRDTVVGQIEFFLHTPVLEIWRPLCRCWKLEQMGDEDIGAQQGVVTVYRHIGLLLSSSAFYRDENSLTGCLKVWGLVK
jgi:hypothetical protein